MPPKLSKSAKQDLILTHLRATGTCHTLKDLEKTLPAVASINGIQVKEYIQALTDEGKLHVEKIGSGNWYWSFGSDDKAERERQVARVKVDVEKARKSCADAEVALAAETEQRRQDEADEDHAGLKQEEQEQKRDGLLRRRAALQAEVTQLRTAEAQVAGSGGAALGSKGVSQVQTELAGFRQQTEQWTDNIYMLEAYLRKLAAGDRELVDAVLRECYGDEYEDGGLREL